MDQPNESEHRVPGGIGGPRTVWIRRPAIAHASTRLLVLLDGEFYRKRMPTAEVVDVMQFRGELPAVWTLFVAQGEQPDRWRNSMCNAAFADHLADELVPWTFEEIVGRPIAPVAIGGLSLSGLQAIFTATRRPDVFPRVFAQSPSCWWSQAWLATECEGRDLVGLHVRQSCGADESANLVDHGSGLVQEMSQLEGCRRVHGALSSSGAEAVYEVVDGGHDFETWTRDLPACVRFAFDVGGHSHASGGGSVL